MGQCQSCGVELVEGADVCRCCGRAVPEVEQKRSPRIAVAGLVLGIAGVLVAAAGLPFLCPLLGLAGFVPALIGYRQAKCDGLPTRLALAATILGAGLVVVPVAIFLLMFLAFAFLGP
jgi:hypothetical protein